jgi:hypothetical protein
MPEVLNLLPAPFWIALLILIVLAVLAVKQINNAIGLPMLAVLGTVAVWYFGDALYNDYAGYIQEIGPDALESAWWEVALFLASFGFMAPRVHHWMNGRLPDQKSNLMLLVKHGARRATKFQRQIDKATLFLAGLWATIMLIALIRTNFDFAGNFMPYLGEKAEPWGRGRIGAGFDFLIALAGYVLIGLAAVFGVIAALATKRSTQLLAIVICILAMPNFIFDRTRSAMLAVLLPGFCAWVFLRLRAPMLVRIAILVMGFLALDSWFKFVLENRSTYSIASAFAYKSEIEKSRGEQGPVHHLGLNMFAELGHENDFIERGTYHPNWGARYFAELVNPIPRVLWPGKPMIGIDYAIARGMGYGDAGKNEGGVGATISTGMIGQGVVNFGGFFGPMAAAYLMALWVAILARQDLMASKDPARVFLYTIGFFLTFNMGRDITLLVTYPFVFGYILLVLVNKWSASRSTNVSRPRARAASHPAQATATKLSHSRLAPAVRK